MSVGSCWASDVSLRNQGDGALLGDALRSAVDDLLPDPSHRRTERAVEITTLAHIADEVLDRVPQRAKVVGGNVPPLRAIGRLEPDAQFVVITTQRAAGANEHEPALGLRLMRPRVGEGA